MGQVLGLNKREDYLLFDLHSGKNFPINLSLSGKNVSITTGASGCRKRNALVNVCRDVTTDTRERLYDELGMKNIRHYIWAVYWFKTPTGPYMVALEDGFDTLSATKLDTGEKRIAFHRGLGISDFSVTAERGGAHQGAGELGVHGSRYRRSGGGVCGAAVAGGGQEGRAEGCGGEGGFRTVAGVLLLPAGNRLFTCPAAWRPRGLAPGNGGVLLQTEPK